MPASIPALGAAPDATAATRFIDHWRAIQQTDATELATSQSFVLQLCDLLGVPQPTLAPDYTFERPLTEHFADGGQTARRIRLPALAGILQVHRHHSTVIGNKPMPTGTIELRSVLRAPPARVYKAFVNAEAKAKRGTAICFPVYSAS